MQCRTNVQLECSWMMWSVMGRCNTHTQTHARAYKYTHIHVHTHTQYALIQWQWHTQTRIHTDTLTCIHIVHKLTHIGKQIQLQHVIATLWDSLHWKVYLDGCTIGSTEERSAISPMFCKDQSGAQWCETNLEIYRWLFLGSMYMGTTFGQQGSGGSHPKIWSNTVKTSLRWQEETESNLFPMGQKHLLFLLLTKHISVCLAAISTPALISTDQQHVFALQLSVAVLKLYFFVFLVIVMPC